MSTRAQDMQTTTVRFGEVVEASVETLVGQCHRLYEAPVLGTLVRAGEDVYGVVSGVATTALDPTRRVIARGADAVSESDVYAEHPQLEHLLRTDVTLAIVGHRPAPLIGHAPVPGEGEVRQYLPPLPPRIHTFLYVCAPEEVQSFFSPSGGGARLDFLPLLLRPGQSAGDDVLAAVLRQAAMAFEAPRRFLMEAARAVAVLLAADTARLNAVLRRLPLSDGQ